MECNCELTRMPEYSKVREHVADIGAGGACHSYYSSCDEFELPRELITIHMQN